MTTIEPRSPGRPHPDEVELQITATTAGDPVELLRYAGRSILDTKKGRRRAIGEAIDYLTDRTGQTPDRLVHVVIRGSRGEILWRETR